MAEPISEQGVAERPSRGRSIAAAVCLVLAALLTTPAAVAFWGQRTLNDAQRYMETVGPLVDSPEVQAAIATKVTAAIQQQVDVEAILNEVFAGVITDRPRLQALVGPISGAVNGLIETQVREFVASDTFADFWVAANTRAQAALVRLLQGDEIGGHLAAGRPGRPGRVRGHRPGEAAPRRARPHDRGEGPDPGHGPADRADGRAPAGAGAHHLRVREPGGQVADRGRRVALSRRARAVAPPAEDDGDHRGGAGGERAAGGVGAVGRPPAVRQPAGRHRVRSGEHGVLRPAAVLPRSAVSRCCSGWV